MNSDDDELLVSSKDGVWYFVKFSEKKFSCFPLTSETEVGGSWVLDQAAGNMKNTELTVSEGGD